MRDENWRYDNNHVRPHSSLGNQAPAVACRTLEQLDGSAPGALRREPCGGRSSQPYHWMRKPAVNDNPLLSPELSLIDVR